VCERDLLVELLILRTMEIESSCYLYCMNYCITDATIKKTKISKSWRSLVKHRSKLIKIRFTLCLDVCEQDLLNEL